MWREVLNTLAHGWGDRCRSAALSVDDDVPSLQRYLGAHAALAHQLRAAPELLHIFGVEALPTLVLIDASRRVQVVSSDLANDAELRRLLLRCCRKSRIVMNKNFFASTRAGTP